MPHILKSFALFLAFISLAQAEESKPVYELTYEVFSLPMSAAADLRRANLESSQMYARLVKMTSAKKASQEKLLIFQFDEKHRVRANSTEALIYPSESNFGRFHGTLKENPHVVIPPFPLPQVTHAYETKNLGDTIQAWLKTTDKGLILGIQALHITLVGRDTIGNGVTSFTFPRFGVQKLSVQVRTPLEKPILIGTVSPHLDHPNPKSDKIVWLAWATTSRSKK